MSEKWTNPTLSVLVVTPLWVDFQTQVPPLQKVAMKKNNY